MLKSNLSVLGFFALCALCFFGLKIGQGYVLAPGDGFVQNFPAFASKGNLWTPLLLSGFPILADPQVQAFYPLAWLAKHLPLGADLTANFNLYVVSAYILAAYFAALLARRLTGSTYAALIAGLVYGFSGYLISELRHVQVLHTALWLPLILYLIEVAMEDRASSNSPSLRLPLRFLAVLLVISLVVACTVFAGHPQTALYVLATALAYAIFLSAVCKRSLLHLCPTLAALGVGILLTAVQLLPSIELSSFSARTTFTFRDFTTGQIEPLQAVGFVLPYILGGRYGVLSGVPFSEQGPPPGLLFFGFAPLLLGLFAVVKGQEQKRIWFFAAVTVLAFILSLGGNTPLAWLVYQLPFVGSFRILYRLLIIPTLGIAMLSAFGLARLEKEYWGENSQKQALDLGQVGPSKHLYFFLYAILSCFSYPFLIGSLPILLFFIKLKRLPFLYRENSTIRQKILMLSIFATLGTYVWSAEWSVASPSKAQFNPPAIASFYAVETSRSLSRIFTVKGLEGDPEQLPPNLSRLWGLSSATGYEPLVSLRYSRLLGIAEGGFIQPPWHISGVSKAFDITSVKYLFAPWGEFSQDAFDNQSKEIWKLVQARDKTLIYENKDVLPRFYFVPEARWLPAEAIYQSIIGGKLPDGAPFVPAAVVLIEGPASAPEAKATTEIKGDYQISEYSLANEKLVFKVRLAKSGYFVLADLFYPGWQATVDGNVVKILPANYVQRAVALDKGEHTLIFAYHPDSLSRGRMVSLVTLLSCLSVLLIAWMCGRSRAVANKHDLG